MIKILKLAVLSFLLGGCTTQSSYIQPNHSGRPSSSMGNNNNHPKSPIENDNNTNSYSGYKPTQENSPQGQQYLCSNISDNLAQVLFNQGHTYLDRDRDGKPCEWKDKYLESQITQQINRQSTSRGGGSCHQVRGYYRKNGTYVRGHTRCR